MEWQPEGSRPSARYTHFNDKLERRNFCVKVMLNFRRGSTEEFNTTVGKYG